MATTTSIVGAVSHTNYNNLMADDSAVSRIREAQSVICSSSSPQEIKKRQIKAKYKVFILKI